MDCIDAIQGRRSIRRFLNKPVPFEHVMALIEAAGYAPCAGNLQEWRFVILTKKALIQEIANQCGGQHWIATAPLVIVVCTDTERASQYYGLRGERLYCVQDAAAATQNMLLAAHCLELGACWIGAFDESRIKDILSIPPHVRPQALVAVGYADESPKPRELVPIDSNVFFNVYGSRIEKIHRVLKDYSEEWQELYEKASERAKPILDKTSQQLKKVRKKILRR